MLGEQIKALRLARHLTQVELAKELNVTKQSVSNWENDNILPSIEVLKKIAEYFSCSTDYLLEMNKKQLLIETDGLTMTQIAHIQLLIDDLREVNAIHNQKNE